MADLSQVTITFMGNAGPLLGAVGQVQGALGAVEAATGKMTSGFDRGIAAVGKFGAAMAALGAAGVAAGLTSAVTAATDFEKQMSAVGAVAGATAGEMQSLTQLALQLGKDTSFSATASAQGLEELVKAGVGLGDIMGGAAKGALDLAAAGAISVKDAAEIAANAMNTFGIKGSEMAHVADVIAGAANASAIDVGDFKFSLASVGAVAATVGVSFEDTAVAIAALGQAGIKGSDAGTSLKTMLLNLSPSTKKARQEMQELGIITATGANRFFDAQGKIKPMAQVFEVLADATKDLTHEQKINALQTIFGTDAIRASAIAARLSAGGFEQMAEAMSKVTAAQVADERLNNLAGSLEKLKGSLETAAITVGLMLTPALKGLVDQATGIVNQVIPYLEEIPDVVRTVGQVFRDEWAPDATIRPFALAVGNMALTVKGMVDTALPYLRGFGESFSRILSGDIGGGLDRFVGAVGAVAGKLGPILAEWGQAFIAWIGPMVPPFLAAIGDIGRQLFVWIGQQVAPLTAQLTAWGREFWAWVTPTIGPLLAEAAKLGAGLLAWIGQQAGPLAAQLVTWATALVQWATPLLPQVLATLGQVAAGVVDWIAQQGPGILAQLAEWGRSFVAWVAPTIPPLLTALGGVLTTLGGWIVGTALPELQAKLGEWGTAFVAWVQPTMAEMGVQLGASTKTMWEQIAQAYTDARVKISGIMREANTRDSEEHKVSLTSILQNVRQWGADYLAFQGSLNTQLTAGYGSFFARTIELHREFYGSTLPAAIQQGFDAYLEIQSRFSAGAVRLFEATLDQITNVHRAFWNGIVSGFQSMVDNVRAQLNILRQIIGSFSLPSWFGGGALPSALPSGDGGMVTTSLRNVGTYVSPYGNGVPAAVGVGTAQVSQFNLGLSPGEAAAACGPAALAWFMNQTGRTPTGAEARALAQQAGWDAQRGMYGPGAFSNALSAAGIPNRIGYNPSDAEIDALARSGVPFALSTGEHYYQVSGGSAAGLNVGASGTALTTGSSVMSLEEIRRRGYPVNAVVVPDLPAPAVNPAAFAGGNNFEKLLPGADPSHWPLLLDATNDMLPPWLQTMQTIRGVGAETFAAVADAAVREGGALVTASTDSLGNVTRIFQDAGGVVGATITDAAGTVVNAWGTMATTVPAQARTMTEAVTGASAQLGTRLVSDVTNAAGVTVERYREMSGEVVTIVTDGNGRVLADFTQTAADIGATMDASRTQLIGTTTDAMGRTVEVYREKTGEIVTLVIGSSGQIVQTITDANQRIAAQTAESGAAQIQQWQATNTGVVAAATAMGLGVIGQSRIWGEFIVTNARSATGEMVSIVSDAAGRIVGRFGDIVEGGKQLATGLDVAKGALRDLTREMKDTERQAEKTADGIRDAWDAAVSFGGKRGGDSGKNLKAAARASGGPVDAFGLYMVGERGPEYFVPRTDGYILNAAASRRLDAAGGGGGGVDEARLAKLMAQELAAVLPARGDVHLTVNGTEERIVAAVLRAIRQQDWLLSGKGPR